MTDNQDELVERVARAITGPNRADHDAPCIEGGKSVMRKQWELRKSAACNALSALRPGDTYNGHMWVPVYPTDEMWGAFLRHNGCGVDETGHAEWSGDFGNFAYSWGLALQSAKGDK